jgi:hypothetical protein
VALANGAFPDSGTHELGHCFGLHHIHLPLSGEDQPDPPYDSEPNGGRLIGASFDVRTGEVVKGKGDIMTYEVPRRTGPTTWKSLLDRI